jgi:hypothetical protein
LLDTQITPELHAEGLARELINRIQNLRKQAGLDVSQHIQLVLACSGILANVANDPALREIIARETLADRIDQAAPDAPLALAHVKRDTIEGEAVSIALAPA